MWSISMLKENAKRMLRGYYWVAFGATLIVMILAGGLTSQFKTDETDLNKAAEIYMGSRSTDREDYVLGTDEGVYGFGGDSESSSGTGAEGSAEYEAAVEQFEKIFGDMENMSFENIISTVVTVVLVIVIISMVISLLYSFLFANPLLAGHNRFYLDARMGNARISNIFSQFAGGKYGNTVKTMFLSDFKLWAIGLLGLVPFIIFIFYLNSIIPDSESMTRSQEIVYFFASLENFYSDAEASAQLMEIIGFLFITCFAGGLLMIPQFIKRLSYTLVPYIIAENPQMPQKRAFEISVKTMKGEKAHYFGLQMSFIGWSILAAFAGSMIGQFVGVTFGSIITMVCLAFLYPYIYATYAEFYCCMREKAMATGIASSDELNGVFGKAAQGEMFPGQDAANFMAYQRVDTSSDMSGSYPAYPQNNGQNASQPSEPVKDGMDEISTDSSSDKIDLEKKDKDDFSDPEIK